MHWPGLCAERESAPKIGVWTKSSSTWWAKCEYQERPPPLSPPCWFLPLQFGGRSGNSGIIATDDNRQSRSELNLAKGQRDDYKDKLNGATPDQAKEQLEDLQRRVASLANFAISIEDHLQPIRNASSNRAPWWHANSNMWSIFLVMLPAPIVRFSATS